MPNNPPSSERELCADSCASSPARSIRDDHLVWRGRTLTADCLVQIGSTSFLLRFDAGNIRECRTAASPVVSLGRRRARIHPGLGRACGRIRRRRAGMTSSRFPSAARCPSTATCSRFMAHLQYFKDVLTLPRTAGA